MKDPSVSIIVCTKNRSAHLPKCLRSLSSLAYPPYEIVVVDSNTKQSEKTKCEESCERNGACHIYEPRKGLSIARNRGIMESHGRIIAFTDDDCIVNKFWLKHLVKNFFGNSEVACCTGRTKTYYTDRLSTTFEKYYSFDRGSKRKTFGRESLISFASLFKAFPYITERRITAVAPAPFSVGLGNNMAFRREILDQIGYFDETLGRGTPSEAGEELDMFYRVLKTGKLIVYEPEAIVFHRHRQTEKDLEEAVYTCGTGVAAFLKKYMERGESQAFLCYLGRLMNLLTAATSYRKKGIADAAFLTSVELKGWISGLSKY